LEENYKRDSELFRNESMKRDLEIEDERNKSENEVRRLHSKFE